jgi:hypothetical protein
MESILLQIHIRWGFVYKSISAFATHLHAQDIQILAKSPRIYLKDSRTLSDITDDVRPTQSIGSGLPSGA